MLSAICTATGVSHLLDHRHNSDLTYTHHERTGIRGFNTSRVYLKSGQFLPEQLSYIRPDQLYGVTDAER